ncbi:response regulator transcription factor [Paenibacillus sp. Marseille-Q4541]|uniref:response regulator transcription factor n=1 Tax=Paenibacillus sp. Marseille-Q4541 TaxID=2831522 RepID=UPI001BA979CF|nr:response regulator transcription factor [Paenibacillus sp. Marseille-Q4541]
MANTVTLERQVKGSVYDILDEQLRGMANEHSGVVFVHCKDMEQQPEAELRDILTRTCESEYQVWQDAKTETLAVFLPFMSLNRTHYQALVLKQGLLQLLPGSDPRLTVASFPEMGKPSKHLLKNMAETAKLSNDADIKLYTQNETASLPGKILIVDQDESTREFLQIRLALQGYDIYEAVDGLSALEMAVKVEPDLILTELNLYGMSGVPFIHQMQNLNLTTPPKVIVLTDQRVEQTISQCFEKGVDDYVTKPFSPVELDARIRRCFQ